MIGGWKTKLGTVALLILGIIDIANGDIQSGAFKISEALGIYGVAHKIEKGGK